MCWLAASTWQLHRIVYSVPRSAAAAKSLQSCPTLCDPHRQQPTRLPRPWDSPGKNTGVGCHFLLQCMKVSRVRLFATPWTAAYQTPPPMGFGNKGSILTSPSDTLRSEKHLLNLEVLLPLDLNVCCSL